MAIRYYLPCACGKKQAVETSQAGESVRCACGAVIQVPSMRHMARLEPVGDPGTPSLPVWGPRQSVLFLGAILVALSIAGTLVVWATFPPALRRDREPEQRRLRQQFRQMSPREALWIWNDLARRGIGSGVTPEQQALAGRRREHMRWFYLAASIGTVGLIMLGAGISMVRQPRAE